MNKTTTSIHLAAEHGIFLGALYSILSAIYIAALWAPAISLFYLPVIFTTMFIMSRMHIVRRQAEASYTVYTLCINAFAVLLASVFLFLLILAIGYEQCMMRLAGEILSVDNNVSQMPGVSELAHDARVHVASLALEYWLLGVLLLSPLGNLLALFTLRLNDRIHKRRVNK